MKDKEFRKFLSERSIEYGELCAYEYADLYFKYKQVELLEDIRNRLG